MSEIINGARTSFGRRNVEPKAALLVPDNVIKHMVVPFNYNDLPAAGDAQNDATYGLIPANAFIVASRLYVETAFVGGTSYNIGLYQADGTVIDADGLDAGVLTAALTANTWIDNDGALVGAGIGTAAGQVVIAATGTYTAGQGKIVISYIEGDLPDKA